MTASQVPASPLGGPVGVAAIGRPCGHCRHWAALLTLWIRARFAGVSNGRSQPYRAILELAEEVGVTIVPGVLLDHVQVDGPQ
jgi:hypothetical protein